MAKKNNTFFCKECGFETTGWTGKCPSCGEWNTMVEAPTVSAKSSKSSSPTRVANQFSWTNQTSTIKLSDAKEESYERKSSGIKELDALLGGGITSGAVFLIGGEPGIGKSTLLLQIANTFDSSNGTVLYVSGEESASQIASRADRLNCDKSRITVCTRTCFEEITSELDNIKPSLVIIDSIQTLYSEAITGTPGSVSQAREVTAGLVRIAKSNNLPIFLVGHITKDGNIAGPKTLEHMVDTVLYFEGENLGTYRILRSIKNRFGKSGEIAFWEMTEQGLIPVNDSHTLLISGHPVNVPGSTITATVEGTKAIAIEIQALLTPSGYGTPQRMTSGIDRNRLAMLLAVTDKFLNLNTPALDSFVNVIGGLKISDTALDLAIISSIVSSVRGVPVKENTMIIGEVGLSGEIRPVSQLYQRVLCARQIGATTLILPSSCKKSIEKIKQDINFDTSNKKIIQNTNICDKILSLEFVYVDTIAEAIDVIFS